MNFFSVFQLLEIVNTAFPPGHLNAGECYQSEYVDATTVISFGWDTSNGDMRWLSVGRYGDSSISVNNVKTFAELKQLCHLIGLTYPENWP